jgi:hypothetical protein
VISLQKEDSLLVIFIVWIAKKFSVILEPLANLVLLSKTENAYLAERDQLSKHQQRDIRYRQQKA